MELHAPNPRGDGSHGLLLTLLLGAVPLRRKLLLSLVAELLQQVAFAYLRTQLQLGYVVGGSVAQISNVLTISCFVGLPELFLGSQRLVERRSGLWTGSMRDRSTCSQARSPAFHGVRLQVFTQTG